MKLSESILEWQSVDDMPECDRQIAVLVKKEYGVTIHSFNTLPFAKKKVDFLDYEVLAWAYLDFDKIQKDIKNKNFDYEWVKSLHDNATQRKEV